METREPTEPADISVVEMIASPEMVEGELPPRKLFEMEAALDRVKLERDIGKLAGTNSLIV